jgi:hypothetical protein
MIHKAAVVVCLISVACLAGAQTRTAKHRTNAQIMEFIVSDQERKVVQMAEAMPAEKYSFTPSGASFEGVRSFGEQLKHIAADNYVFAAAILGEALPSHVDERENGPTSLQTKAEVLTYLKRSFVEMHRAAAHIDDRNEPIATPGISPWPAGTATRMGLAIEDCVHTWDHYGQLIEYLRMNGIVPPASRPRGAGK